MFRGVTNGAGTRTSTTSTHTIVIGPDAARHRMRWVCSGRHSEDGTAVITYFGDGATSQATHQAFNYAAVIMPRSFFEQPVGHRAQ